MYTGNTVQFHSYIFFLKAELAIIENPHNNKLSKIGYTFTYIFGIHFAPVKLTNVF